MATLSPDGANGEDDSRTSGSAERCSKTKMARAAPRRRKEGRAPRPIPSPTRQPHDAVDERDQAGVTELRPRRRSSVPVLVSRLGHEPQREDERAIPTGTLTKKIQGQESTRRTPPSTSRRPHRQPRSQPDTDCLRRSGPSLKVEVTIASAAGETRRAETLQAAADDRHVAPARRRRAARRGEQDNPGEEDALRPARSPARPPRRRKPPNISVYAFTTHCRSASVISRSLWIVGSATLTIVASRMTMNCARQTSTRTSHGLTGGAWCARSSDERISAPRGCCGSNRPRGPRGSRGRNLLVLARDSTWIVSAPAGSPGLGIESAGYTIMLPLCT